MSMQEDRFTNREIKLMLSVIDERLKKIHEEISGLSKNYDSRFSEIDFEINSLKDKVADLSTLKMRILFLSGVIFAAISIAINKFL